MKTLNLPAGLATSLCEAYNTLFTAVENGIDNYAFFRLREQHRHINQRIHEFEVAQRALRRYAALAFFRHLDNDQLNVDEDASVSASDEGDGAFVGAWIWIPRSDLPVLATDT